jgi:hypothetical protein
MSDPRPELTPEQLAKIAGGTLTGVKPVGSSSTAKTSSSSSPNLDPKKHR